MIKALLPMTHYLADQRKSVKPSSSVVGPTMVTIEHSYEANFIHTNGCQEIVGRLA